MAWLSDRWPWIATAIGLLVVLLVHGDYGTTWDEGIQDRYGRLCLDYFASGGRDGAHAELEDLRFYGPLVELLLVAMRGGGDPDFTLRHLGLGLLALLTIPALARIARAFPHASIGAVAVAMLWTTPRFVGHAFNNSKDTPFLLGVTAFMAGLLHVLASAAPRRRDWLLLGLLLGLCLAVRPGGAPLLVVLAVATALLARWTRVGFVAQAMPSPGRLASDVALAVLVAWATMVVAWPWAHAQPLLRPLAAMAQAMAFERSYPVLFEGVVEASDRLPWRYLPEYLLITTPTVYLVLALLSPSYLRRVPPAGRPRARFALYSVTCWLLLPLVAAAVLRPNVYDGLRHFLFVLPALAVLAAVGLVGLSLGLHAFLAAHRPRVSAAGVTALVAVACVAAPVYDTVRLHPYQGSSFNAWVGGIAGAAGRYELDYWGTAMTGAIRWLNRHAAPRKGETRVRVLLGVTNAYPLEAARAQAASHVDIVPMTELPRLVAAGSPVDYYLGLRRYGMLDPFDRAPLTHVEARDGVPLSVVRGLGGVVLQRRPGAPSPPTHAGAAP